MERWQAEGGRRRPGDPPGWNSRPWRAVFLAAFILSSSFLLAQGPPLAAKTAFYNITISADPPAALEGRAVNLTLKHNATNFAFCSWFRGIDVKENLIVTLYLPPLVGNTTGPSHTGREVAGFGCSLFIHNLHLNDSGTYVVTMNGPSVHGKGDVRIQVLEELSKPILWPSKSFVAENASFTLNCNTSNSSTVSVTWSKDSKPFPTNVEFDHGNRTLTLRKFQQPDAGTYTCTAQHLLSVVTSDTSTLTLAYGPKSAQLNRSGTIEEPLGSGLVLQCSAESVPKATFEWFFNNTVKNGTEDTLSVHLKDWEDEGTYTCQATNPFTNHTTSASVYVKLTDESAIQPRMSAAAIAGTTIGTVAGVVLCVIVVYVLWTKVSC
ncbi:carcinoembryonic antigen-related cell adhesion molecule 1-like isoform X2 [Ahaetulla prasina]|nr:carcinoembryonic antigen-related cell adhesion molecule 1-like isoform X2 [Ahaetulla prasina]